jgi:hypothetical protein
MEDSFKSLNETFNITTESYFDWELTEGIDYEAGKTKPPKGRFAQYSEPIKKKAKILRIERKETEEILYENNNSYGLKNYNRIVDDLISDMIEEQRQIIKQSEPKTTRQLKLEYAFNDYDKILKRGSYDKYKTLRVRFT